MNAAEFFAAYDAHGERRAGTPGDAASAAWLRELAAATGAAAELAPVAFSRLIPGFSALIADGREVEGLPLFDGGTTDGGGLVGTLGPLEDPTRFASGHRIAVAEMEPRAASLPDNDFARARRDSRVAAIVVALRMHTGSLAPLNAHDSQLPFGPPVLQLPGREAAWLRELAERGAPAKLLVTGRRASARSANIRATLPGEGPPLVLLTPRTSWWTSTAERAGGILAWLAALRALAAAPRRRAVVALATCAHELGHIGAKRAFAADPDLVPEAPLVLHLGANLGCAGAERLVVRSNVLGLADRMADALVAAGHPRAAIEAVTGGKANGEAHEVEEREGRYLSLIGDNPWFHAPEDRWPATVDLARAEAIAGAAAAIALEHVA